MQVDPTVPAGDVDHLEACTTLGYLAARTERIRLGAMVSPATFREPSVLVAAVPTLALLSRGRAWFGLGAGHDGVHDPYVAVAALSHFLDQIGLQSMEMFRSRRFRNAGDVRQL